MTSTWIRKQYKGVIYWLQIDEMGLKEHLRFDHFTSITQILNILRCNDWIECRVISLVAWTANGNICFFLETIQVDFHFKVPIRAHDGCIKVPRITKLMQKSLIKLRTEAAKMIGICLLDNKWKRVHEMRVIYMKTKSAV